jgi:hypothetical protein
MMPMMTLALIPDHFWPAMYPGIIVGVLVGLSYRSVLSTLLGAIGGLAGAIALYFVFKWFSLEDTFFSLAGLIGGSAVGAYLLVAAAGKTAGPGDERTQ